eukprot:EG_transcript_17415
MGSAAWELKTCCNVHQIIFVCLFSGFLVLDLLLWRTPVVRPFKFLAVFIHEMSHAAACWVSCGKVHEIKVYTNEGGVTRYEGGCRCFIIPAGYVGCAFWGMILVILSANRVASTCAAAALCAALGFSLFFKPPAVWLFINLGLIAGTVAAVLIDWMLLPTFLGYVTLFYGVFIGAFAIYDIYDDLITRTVEGSDAQACHQLVPCCLPRMVGVSWALVAILMLCAGVYLSLVWMG